MISRDSALSIRVVQFRSLLANVLFGVWPKHRIEKEGSSLDNLWPYIEYKVALNENGNAGDALLSLALAAFWPIIYPSKEDKGTNPTHDIWAYYKIESLSLVYIGINIQPRLKECLLFYNIERKILLWRPKLLMKRWCIGLYWARVIWSSVRCWQFSNRIDVYSRSKSSNSVSQSMISSDVSQSVWWR